MEEVESLFEIHLGMAATDGPENWIVDPKKGPENWPFVCPKCSSLPPNMKYPPKTWFGRLVVLDLFILDPLYWDFHIGWDDFLWSHTQVASQCMA